VRARTVASETPQDCRDLREGAAAVLLEMLRGLWARAARSRRTLPGFGPTSELIGVTILAG